MPPTPSPDSVTRPPNLSAQQRRDRCSAMGLQLDGLEDSLGCILAHSNPLATVVSSRLGHDVGRHRRMARHLVESMRAFRADGSTLLIAKGTAIELWAMQAADIFGVPTLVLEDSDDRDLHLFALADRVDVVYSRSSGKIANFIQKRCELPDEIVRVAVHSKTELTFLQRGAVGRFLPSEPEAFSSDAAASNEDHYWQMGSQVDGSELDGSQINCSHINCSHIDSVDWDDFLVHCTRATQGPWPQQTAKQYRDDILLGDVSVASRTAAAALFRIVRQRRLIAGAVASAKVTPVVCASAVPLPELLNRRTYRSHLHRWDYEPYGIAIRKSASEKLGFQPVVYGDSSLRKQLPPDKRFLFQAAGQTSDWRAEKEWRTNGDANLDLVDPKDICVFTDNRLVANQLSAINFRSWNIVRVQ